ncbi:MAG: hypothetical protein ACJ71U_02225 [Terriglobales bacterium]|jgi:hypothetical protein
MGRWWILYLAVLAVLTGVYHYFRQYRSTITFCATFLAAIAAILQLQATAAQNREDIRIKKIAVAFTYFDSWNKDIRPVAKPIMAVMHEIDGKSGEEANKIFEADPEKLRKVLTGYDFFENMALSIRLRSADEAALCQYFSQTSTQFFAMGRNWLSYRRQSTQQPGAYEQYESLYNAWHGGCPSSSV